MPGIPSKDASFVWGTPRNYALTNFLMVWNDFNFYFDKSMKWAWNSKYFDEVRKYVYMKVYQKGNRLQK